MITQISKGKARQRFSQMCAEANDSMPEFTVVQKMPDGNTREYKRRAKRISDGAQQTGLSLIMYYASHYRTTVTNMPEGWKRDGIPTLPTNGELLAKFRENICARTSRNHIKQLIDVGLIVKKVFHGTKSNFELVFNPVVLFGQENANLTAQMPQFSAVSSTETPQFLSIPSPDFPSENRTNFPLKQAIETNGNHSTSTMNVENSTTWKPLDNSTEWKPSDTHSKTLQKNGNTARETAKNGAESNGNQNLGGPKIYSAWSNWAKNADNAVENVDKSVDNTFSSTFAEQNRHGQDFARQHRVIQSEIVSFWKLAKQSLWPDRTFSDPEWLMIADLLTDSVFRPFLKLKPSKIQFDEFVNELTAAVRVAKKYYDNNPERYPGNPYTTTGNNLGYFDSKNPKGFKVACQWRFINKAKQQEEEGWRVVKTAIMHLNKHVAGKAPKHLQVKTFAQVVDFYKAKLQRHKPETQNWFLRRLSTLTIYNK